ncbi:LytTR family DNA-binding domain-containing protein [Aurantiacibacter sp. D1-12]|uniref:LytTR family DNA-binding domain-containing protein n=1 Tax=Aurantiacibacter sp. D1-12 TaxID=2993658 RepID=UPI00237C8F4E|nr:LytTR family DNA-binding domain-containing protein [Aurantiacibacter sp. D1-12]MDE1468444.1 LytTR family DNA-binding domain-containing protein [Aurantiacibacter sp. D1-12]
MFEHFRAPNTSLLIQLVAMLAFFLCLAAVPRLLWRKFAGWKANQRAGMQPIVIRIAAIGLLLAALHLAALALIKMALYASQEWMALPANIAFSIGETWANYAAIWLAVYALMALGTYLLWKRQCAPADPTSFSFSVRRNDRTLRIEPAEVCWIEAEGNYLEIHTLDGSYTVRDSLTRLAPLLEAHGFIRSHRRALVNTQHVKGVRSCSESSSYRVMLFSGEEAPLGRRRLAEFREKLG